MKNWMRVFLVCLALVGGTAIFVFWSLAQFNSALESLSASFSAIANTPPILSNKKNIEQIPTPTPAPTPEIISTKPSFNFPKINSEIYAGCVYQLLFRSSVPAGSLETVLVDAGSRDIVDPAESGLVRENKIVPNSRSIDWKVGVVWAGEYYIKISNTNGFVLRSNVFSIKSMPKDISAAEREKICIESAS